jgi:DNA-directed RNA polymerase specialized sigma24 family protein
MTGTVSGKASLVTQSDDNTSIDPERCVDEYGDDLFRYGMSRLRDDNAAEEVVQETFLAGLRFQGRDTGEGAERARLPAILNRKLIDYVCRRYRYDREGYDEGSNSSSEKMSDESGNWKSGSFTAPTQDGRVASREV